MGLPPPPPAELVSLLEHLPGCRLLIDADYRIVASNTCYRNRCHAGGERDVIGRHCYEVSHGYDAPCDAKGESCPRHAVLRSGQADRCVHVHHTAHGADHVAVELIPLLDDLGSITLFMEHLEPMSQAGRAGACVGSDPAFLSALALVGRVARSTTSVLMLGETGTGKEVLARTLHDMSDRADRPFVVVDCAGLAETLFESELFGYEKGAFTGATARKPGLVEAAAGGTLFIDEVGDIPLSLQVKLLRVLETGLFRRVGGTDMQRTDFRLIAATHRDLAALVAQGQFRSDLYYRISAYPIHVPALRERGSDIPALANSILGRLEHGRSLGLAPSALHALAQYPFPGNVRELRNVLERASLLAETDTIEVRHLPDHVAARASAPESSLASPVPGQHSSVAMVAPGDEVATLADAERVALRRAARDHSGSRRALAGKLGISERTLYRKLRALDAGE